MSINIIAAISKNRVIGLNGKIPWKINKDLKYFQKLTSNNKEDKSFGKAVIMGRKTWDSLPKKPLKNRENYVITNKYQYIENACVLNNPDMIKHLYSMHDSIWICGGENTYNYYINKPYIDKIYLTEIDIECNGDAFFPKIPEHYALIKKGSNNTFKYNATTYINYNFNVYQNMNFDDKNLKKWKFPAIWI